MSNTGSQHQDVQECTRCILDSHDSAVMQFDAEGVCHVCRAFEKDWINIPKTEVESKPLLEDALARMRAAGRGKDYDCLLGISGGVDSTYMALLTRDYGIRPLLVHFDNGWNSELAVDNINRVVNELDLDLVTYVVDWEEFKALQIAYLRASVVDIEVVTDHAIYGAVNRIAHENNIKFILSGVNVATEFVLLADWIYDKLDATNIKHIYSLYGDGTPLKTYPFLDRQTKKQMANWGVESIRLLDLIPYDIEHATQRIKDELGWRSYTGKHFESIFTRFYQEYILPKKFGIVKRKAHLSNLICSGQLTKTEALQMMNDQIYSPKEAEEDKAYVLKKLQLTAEEFDQIMQKPPQKHEDFDREGSFFGHYPALKPLRPIWNRVRNRS